MLVHYLQSGIDSVRRWEHDIASWDISLWHLVSAAPIAKEKCCLGKFL